MANDDNRDEGNRMNPQGKSQGGQAADPGRRDAGLPGPDKPVTDHHTAPGTPEYGQMASQYGPGYNPYLFGAPAPDNQGQSPAANGGAPAGGQAGPNQAPGMNGTGLWNGQPGNQRNGFPGGYPGGWQGGNGPMNGNGYGPQGGWNGAGRPGYGPQGPNPYGQNPYGQNPYGQNPYGPSGNPQGGPNPYGYTPNGGPNNPYGFQGFLPFNPDDPNQNPLYGHWDWMSIVAFLLSFSLFFSFLSLPMAFVSYNRCKTLHMKGKGFAIAAIVLSIVNLILLLVATLNPGLFGSMGSMVGSGAQAGQSTAWIVPTLTGGRVL